MGCCFTIPQSEVGVLEYWGKFDRVCRPGFHFMNPITSEVAGKLSLRVQVWRYSKNKIKYSHIRDGFLEYTK